MHEPRTWSAWSARRQRRRVPSLAGTRAALPPLPQHRWARKQVWQMAAVMGQAGSMAKVKHTTPATTRRTRVPGPHSSGQTAATDNTPTSLPKMYTNQSRPRPLHRATCLPCVSARRVTRITAPMRVNLAPSTLATDAPTAIRHPSRVHRQHYQGKTTYFARCSCPTLVKRPARTSLDICLHAPNVAHWYQQPSSAF